MRVRNWERRLYAALAAVPALEYGRNDCGLFVGRCIRAVTGEDPAQAFRGYRGRAGALNLVRQHGGLESLVTSVLGAQQPPRTARRGDVVAIPHPRFGVSLGVCDGRYGVFLGSGSTITVPRSLFSTCWRVG